MNLRDWQKKASDFGPLDSEIDLLLQIIEKQSEALEFYAKDSEFLRWCEKNENPLFRSVFESMKNNHDAVASKARTAQAEVQGLVEKLMGEK
jgi:hypothetical protein